MDVLSEYIIGETALASIAPALDEDNTMVFNRVRSLSKEELERFKSAKANFEKWIREDFDSFAALETAYAELNLKYDSLEAAMLSAQRFRQNDAKMIINGTVNNFLPKLKTWLDHTDRRLARAGLTAERNEFKTMQSNKFDSSFAYCFALKLRDFTEHNSQSVTEIKSSSDINGENSFEVSFSRDYLLGESNRWGAVVKPQLSAQPAEFPLMTLMTDAIKDFRDLHNSIIKNNLARLKEDCDFLKSLQQETSADGVTSQALLIKLKFREFVPGATNNQLEMIDFPNFELAKYEEYMAPI